MKKSKSLKTIALTLTTIFNLAVTFAATFAWFTAAKQLQTFNIATQIEAHELNLNYEIYKFDDNVKDIVKTNDLSLNPYDTVIKEKNKNNVIVIKATLQSNFFLGKSTYDVNISIACTETTASTDYLSNITCFKFSALTEIENIYYDSIVGLENVTPLKFITTVKLTEINFNILNAPVINNRITIYGLFNYDDDLITAKSINIVDEIPIFINDIEYIRFAVHE